MEQEFYSQIKLIIGKPIGRNYTHLRIEQWHEIELGAALQGHYCLNISNMVTHKQRELYEFQID